jgi:tRNA 2-thiouridine synthesizing protein A
MLKRMNADPAPAELLDCRGELCPVPVARTRLALRRSAEGARLRVWCTDPMATLDIAALCAREGHQLLLTVEHLDGHTELQLQRGVR